MTSANFLDYIFNIISLNKLQVHNNIFKLYKFPSNYQFQFKASIKETLNLINCIGNFLNIPAYYICLSYLFYPPLFFFTVYVLIESSI
jgi:hypothetical protein